MYSKIYTGNVSHYRLSPVVHKFTYPYYMYYFDLDNLETLQSSIKIFGYNKIRPISIHDKDYLTKDNFSIKTKLKNYLIEKGFILPVEKVFLLTAARYFNYVFNPVSFYYCFDANQNINYIVVEINNTFKEKHSYILDGNEKKALFNEMHFQNKTFHVSPFYSFDYQYEFIFSEMSKKLDIQINMNSLSSQKKSFYSRLMGEPVEMNSINLYKTIIKYPLTASLTMPRILWQAIKLHYVKKLPAYYKPKPASENTLTIAKPSYLQKIAQEIILKILTNIKYGQLVVDLPNKEKVVFGNLEDNFQVFVSIEHYDFFYRLLIHGDIALGETYSDGLWNTTESTKFLRLLILNRECLESKVATFAPLRICSDLIKHLLKTNSLTGAKKNISAHYDLSNDLFKLFLDKSMTYSAAIFSKYNEDLETAQMRKIDKIINKAKISKDDHVLEIGCGWGAFAIRAVQTTNCKVTCLTLSKEQASYFQNKINTLGLSDKINIQLKDFREVEGTFNKIISIEMIEAIGAKNYSIYFSALEKLLKPNGIVVLQAITFPDSKFEALKNRCDWIQKYIFPGSLIPSLAALTKAMSENSHLILENLENIGPSYAETLRQWHINFDAKQSEVRSLGFDDYFIKSWKYYFSYCEAGFVTRTLNDHIITLCRPVNMQLIKEDLHITTEDKNG